MLSQLFNASLAAELCAQSQASLRRRAHFSLHGADSDAVHRLFVAMQPDSYVPPHRHLDPRKGESLLIVRGALGFLEFDNAGNVTAQATLGPDTPDWCVDIPPGCWHSVIALETDTLFFETKAGPYFPLAENERAPWAAPEGTADASHALSRFARLFSA